MDRSSFKLDAINLERALLMLSIDYGLVTSSLKIVSGKFGSLTHALLLHLIVLSLGLLDRRTWLLLALFFLLLIEILPMILPKLLYRWLLHGVRFIEMRGFRAEASQPMFFLLE